MIWITLFYCIMYPVLAWLSVSVFLEIRSYILLVTRYKRQGVPILYVPILGFSKKFNPDVGNPDQNHKFKSHYKEYSEKGMMAFKDDESHNCKVVLSCPKLVQEFFRKELNVSGKRIPPGHFNFDFMGFFFLSGKKAMRLRGVSADLFHFENIQKFCPVISRIAEKHILSLKHKSSSTEWNQVNLKNDLLADILDNISLAVFFGHEDMSTFPDLPNGDNFIRYYKDILSDFFNLYGNFWNMLFLRIPEKLSILPIQISLLKKRKIASKFCWDQYKKGSTKKLQSSDFLSLMRKYNNKMEDEGTPHLKLIKDDFYSHFEPFQLGITETAFQVATSTLVSLAQNQEAQQKLYDEIKTIETGDKLTTEMLDSSEYMELIIQETLRLKPPLFNLTTRVATKTFKVGNKKIYRGDSILVSPLAISIKEIPNPDDFNLDNFSKEKISGRHRMATIPFSSGRRSCIGQYLGKMIIMITVSHLLKHFEIKEANDGFIYQQGNIPLYGIENPEVLLKVRQSN